MGFVEFLTSGNAPSNFASVEVTADHYHRYKDDLKYLKEFNANTYRFSISWARVLPNCNGEVNQEALKYYEDMIDQILANGAEPVGTVKHGVLDFTVDTGFLIYSPFKNSSHIGMFLKLVMINMEVGPTLKS
jgi:beta-glucosidase/6-phospho-beta-glucosidase/beta-galactosidase